MCSLERRPSGSSKRAPSVRIKTFIWWTWYPHDAGRLPSRFTFPSGDSPLLSRKLSGVTTVHTVSVDLSCFISLSRQTRLPHSLFPFPILDDTFTLTATTLATIPSSAGEGLWKKAHFFRTCCPVLVLVLLHVLRAALQIAGSVSCNSAPGRNGNPDSRRPGGLSRTRTLARPHHSHGLCSERSDCRVCPCQQYCHHHVSFEKDAEEDTGQCRFVNVRTMNSHWSTQLGMGVPRKKDPMVLSYARCRRGRCGQRRRVLKTFL